MKKKLSAEVAHSPTEKIQLLKPQTYMNLSGEAVQKALHYFHIPIENLLVIHDEIDLPFLSLRFHKNRGAAGHKGVKNITQILASQNYSRMRIGVQTLKVEASPDLRKGVKALEGGAILEASQNILSRQVLKPFNKQEQDLLPEFLNTSLEALRYFITEGCDKAANRYNN